MPRPQFRRVAANTPAPSQLGARQARLLPQRTQVTTEAHPSPSAAAGMPLAAVDLRLAGPARQSRRAYGACPRWGTSQSRKRSHERSIVMSKFMLSLVLGLAFLAGMTGTSVGAAAAKAAAVQRGGTYSYRTEAEAKGWAQYYRDQGKIVFGPYNVNGHWEIVVSD
jgi:hypothetical protein